MNAAINLAYESEGTLTVNVLSGQKLTVIKTDVNKIGLWDYIVKAVENPKHILLAIGSWVSLALEAEKLIVTESLRVRFASMPSEFFFEEQCEKYKESVLPCRCKIIAIEAGCSSEWN